MKRVEGKVCLVTGGARGLGLAAAEALLAEGAYVMLGDVDETVGAGEAKRLGDKAAFLVHDVTSEAAWATVLDAVVAKWGRLDVLVNNAGIGHFLDVEALSLQLWKRTLDVNLSAAFIGTKAAIARMKGSGGSIINIASIEGLVGEATLPAYNASKGGIRLLGKSAAIHCARSSYNIRVNNVCPGFAETQMVSDALGALPPETAQYFAAATLARIPMGRFAKPSEIAAAVLFLASDESSYVTGSDLVIDGGLTA